MNTLLKFLLSLFVFAYFSCNQASLTERENEILKKENELLKKEQELNSKENIQEQKTEEKENAYTERMRLNSEVTTKNINFRNNWSNYIKIDNSEPLINYSLGGIGEFQVYIHNETPYILDQVDVNIEYIRKNGELAQEKTISIFNVLSGSSEAGAAPSCVNGVKVNCSISKIISRKMHFCYPADNGNPEDPYFCK